MAHKKLIIKRRLLLVTKAMTNLNNILKGREVTLPTKVCIICIICVFQ